MSFTAKNCFADAAEMMLAYPTYSRFCMEKCNTLMENFREHFSSWHSLCRSLFNFEEHAFAVAALSAQLTLLASFAESSGALSSEAAADAYRDISDSAFRTMLGSVPSFALSNFGTLVRNQQIDICIPSVCILSDPDDIGESTPD